MSEFDVREFGGRLDGTADDSTAFRSALAACDSAGGGTVVIAGRLALRSPVDYAFSPRTSSVILQGYGSGSQVLVRSGRSATAVRLRSVEQLAVEGLYFVGAPGTGRDCATALSIVGCTQASLRNCHFYGLSSATPGGAILTVINSGVTLEDCAFRGCAGDTARKIPVLRADRWRTLRLVGCDFIDYGMLDGGYISKTPTGFAYAWVLVGAPAAGGARGTRHRFDVQDCRFDEGAHLGIHCDPGSSAAGAGVEVRIAGCWVNGATSHGASCVVVDSVRALRVEQCGFGFNSNPGYAVRAAGCRTVELSGLTCRAGFDRILIDARTHSATVANCDCRKVICRAQMKRFCVDGLQSLPVSRSVRGSRRLPPGSLAYNPRRPAVELWTGRSWTAVSG